MTQLPNSEPSRTWHCGRFTLPLGQKTYVMAILNVTPDSFSGDGLSNRVLDSVVERALQAMADGADILDIGGESTRPGAQEVSIEEETRRVVPLVEVLATHVRVPISIDTTKSVVAQRALQAGASIINDISGATHDAQMLSLLAQSDCGIVLMHRRGNSQTMRASQAVNGQPVNGQTAVGGEQSAGNDVIAEVLQFWRERVKEAEKLGIARERIALDAGFGFGKSLQENLEIVRHGRELADFGLPTLSATSRKSTIGRVLENRTTQDYAIDNRTSDNRTSLKSPIDQASAGVQKDDSRTSDNPEINGCSIDNRERDAARQSVTMEDRIWGTASTVALAIANGADIVRVHDVREMALVARLSDAIVR